MAEPTAKVRRETYQRDEHRCASCGARDGLTFQHRRAVGMGGSKVRPTIGDGLTACGLCNARYESDMRAAAMAHGWKVARWVYRPERVPVWDFVTHQWYRLDAVLPVRYPITARTARHMMRVVYGPEGVPE
ncbi:hypothetical protein [Microbacterium caowuchunii]|uniref:HNH endonuclease n=1 Tax=Microbacterium caowuchunii TaxID=2614638 RepID=A0A5N0TF92_9MICO|nr:hypothetical protein [Microbacterium caowuchunii]KAA9133735.1 hypothetical protein F6B40_08255 [Microbacterium caowuchunii]